MARTTSSPATGAVPGARSTEGVSGVVAVTLTLDMDRAALALLGGDDFAGRDRGITTGSCAAAVAAGHDPRLGWVAWAAVPREGWLLDPQPTPGNPTVEVDREWFEEAMRRQAADPAAVRGTRAARAAEG